MPPAVRGIALLLALTLGGYGIYRVSLKANAPVLPAIVTRTADAHRELSTNLDARIDRFLHDRPPVDREGSPRLVALTFDDGPYPVETPLLLDELRDLHVKATFFLVGDDAALFPQLAQRIESEGHEIANHTETHPAFFDRLDARGVTHELDAGAQTLESIASDAAIRTMMRPPHGRFTERTVRAAQRDGYHVILWNDDPGDWRVGVSPSVLAAHVEEHATAPDIILLHSGLLPTVELLPEIVARFRAAGFDFVTVGDLMRRVPIERIDHPERRPV